MEQLEMDFFIKKATRLLAVAFFVIILFVFIVEISVSYFREALSVYEARLADPVFIVSDGLLHSRREAEDSLHKQSRLEEAANVEGMVLTDAARIIKALPEGLYAWELSLMARPRRGELQGIALDINAISQFVESLKAEGDLKSVQLVQLQKYSEDRTDFTVAFQWKEEGSP